MSAAASTPHLRITLLLRAELLKLMTLRSTWWALAVMVLLWLAISLLYAAASAGFGPGASAVTATVVPLQFTMLVAGVLGAISVTGEYATGMIRSSLTAAPRRVGVLIAKALALGAVLAAAGALAMALSLLVTTPIIDGDIDWSDAGTSWLPLAWTVAALVVFGWIGLGFGFVIRAGAGAIAATVGLLFVAPIVFSLFTIGGEDWAWLAESARFLPGNAAFALSSTTGTATSDVLTLLLWPLVLLGLGATVLTRRDA